MTAPRRDAVRRESPGNGIHRELLLYQPGEHLLDDDCLASWTTKRFGWPYRPLTQISHRDLREQRSDQCVPGAAYHADCVPGKPPLELGEESLDLAYQPVLGGSAK